jgi:hypothetical protein
MSSPRLACLNVPCTLRPDACPQVTCALIVLESLEAAEADIATYRLLRTDCEPIALSSLHAMSEQDGSGPDSELHRPFETRIPDPGQRDDGLEASSAPRIMATSDASGVTRRRQPIPSGIPMDLVQ